MSDKESEPFRGFDDNTPCPKFYWKYAERSNATEDESEDSVSRKKKNVVKSKTRSRFVSCRKCANCTQTPCGECTFCLDKLYHGNKKKRRCIHRKCVLKSPKQHTTPLVEEEEETDEDVSSDDEGGYEDDILDQMLNKLLHEGVHKEALFKDLLVYKYWKLRPEPSPDELVSLAKLLNMTMEGIQQILSNSKSDLLPLLSKTESSVVDSNTAREKISEILKRYPKDTLSDINKSKTLKLEIKRSRAKKTPLHHDIVRLKDMLCSDVKGYTHHTPGLFVSVPIWLEGLYLYLTKKELSSLAETRGLRMPKIKKMTTAIRSGELPETLVQCLIDHGCSCPKYMNLSFSTLTTWAKLLDRRKVGETKIKDEPLDPAPSSLVPVCPVSVCPVPVCPVPVCAASSSTEEEEVKHDTEPAVKDLLDTQAEAKQTNVGGDVSEITPADDQATCATKSGGTEPKVEENEPNVEEGETTVGGAGGNTTEMKEEPPSGSIEDSEDEVKEVFEVNEKNDEEVSSEKKSEEAMKKKEEGDSKTVEDTEKRGRRYHGVGGRRGKKDKKEKAQNKKTDLPNYEKLEGGLVTLLWGERSMEQVWTEGFFIPTTEYGSQCPELCYLCGSAGSETMIIYCSACAEPFHKYCLDIEDSDVISADWRCERCIICQVCNQSTQELLLKCCECYHTFHGTCLPRDVINMPSKNGIWKCPVCLVCGKCGAKGDAVSKWLYDYSVCKPCGKLYSKGNYCPLCEAVYEDEDYDTPMVACQSCEHWVHIECDNITLLEYEAMSNLPEERVLYVCRRCSRDTPWRDQMIQCIQENLAHCLEAMEGVVERSKIRVHKYNTVRSIRLFENDVFQYIACQPGAVGTFRTVLNECFPWYPKVKKGMFDVKTPSKTPKKKQTTIWFNSNKVAQMFDSSTFVDKDTRQCVLCSQTGDLSERGCGRLVMCGVDNWIHVNCALWSSEVYEESDGKLMNVEMAVNRGSSLRCDHCGIYNATVGCCDKQCPRSFHFNCGVRSGAVFLSDKRLFCKNHKEKHRKPHWEHMQQAEFTINRRIYIDPSKIGNTKRNTRPINSSSLIPHVGASRITRLGDIMNISDHPDILIPVQYTLDRMFWSFRDPTYRCRYRCQVVKEPPENPDLYFTDLSDDLLTHNQPFTDWVERASGKFKGGGEAEFQITLTIQKPQLNSFTSDSFAGAKDEILTPEKVKAAKTPVKVRAKIRQARDEPPVINLDGVKVKKTKESKRVKRERAFIKEERAGVVQFIPVKIQDHLAIKAAAQHAKRKRVDAELQKARIAALELQKLRLAQEMRSKVRRYAKLDHSYAAPHGNVLTPRPPLEYERHIEPLKVRPGYYIDCISANEGIRSLLQRVGGDDSSRCCGIPFIPPVIVYMEEGEGGRKIVKMAPPPQSRPVDRGDGELFKKERKLKSVYYRMNKKKKQGTSTQHAHKKVQRTDVKHHQQGERHAVSLYSSSQFKTRVLQQIRAYDPQRKSLADLIGDSTSSSTGTYCRVYPQISSYPYSSSQIKLVAKKSLSPSVSKVLTAKICKIGSPKKEFDESFPKSKRSSGDCPHKAHKRSSGGCSHKRSSGDCSHKRSPGPGNSFFKRLSGDSAAPKRVSAENHPKSKPTIMSVKETVWDNVEKRFVEKVTSIRNQDLVKQHGSSKSSGVFDNPILITNSGSSSVKHKSSKIMCIGTGVVPPKPEYTPSRNQVEMPGPSPRNSCDVDSPLRKRYRPHLNVFDFTEEEDRPNMYNKNRYSDKSERSRQASCMSTSSNNSLKLSTTVTPAWVIEGEKEKEKEAETIDVDSWLTQREAESSKKKDAEAAFSFDLHHDEDPHHRVTGSGTGYTWIAIKAVQHEGEGSSDGNRQHPSTTENRQHPAAGENSLVRSNKGLDRDSIINDFNTALSKYGPRKSPPVNLVIPDEKERGPVPMDISPTILSTFKEERMNPATTKDEPETQKPVSSSSPLFPGLPRESAVRRVKQTDTSTCERAKVHKVSRVIRLTEKPATKDPMTCYRPKQQPQASIHPRPKSPSHAKQRVKDNKNKTHTVDSNKRSTAARAENEAINKPSKDYRPSAALRKFQPNFNDPPKSPSPVKELLKDFIIERGIRKELNFDMNTWKSKITEAAKPSPLRENQSRNLVQSFTSYDPPAMQASAPDAPDAAQPAPAFMSVDSFLQNLRNVTARYDEAKGSSNSREIKTFQHAPAESNDTLTVLQTGFQHSPSKLLQTSPFHQAQPLQQSPLSLHQNKPPSSPLSLQDTASILSTSIQLCQTYLGGEYKKVKVPPKSKVEPVPAANTVTVFKREPQSTEESREASVCKDSVPDNCDRISKRAQIPHTRTIPDKNVCQRHFRGEFLSFCQKHRTQVKIDPDLLDITLTAPGLFRVKKTGYKEIVKIEKSISQSVKSEPEDYPGPKKRKSAIIASQNLVEKVYKDEDLEDEDSERKQTTKRKCDRLPTTEASPPKTPFKRRPTQTSSIKLMLNVRQINNRTYIRCRNKCRDPYEKTFPVFVVATEDGVYVETDDADDAWTIISTLIQRIRKTKHQSVLHGLAMWTLAHDSVVHVIEQLPNTHRLEEYSFHFLEHGPQRAHLNKALPVPPGGCARTMPVVRKTYIDQFAFLNHPFRNVKPPSIDDSRLAVAMGDTLYNRRTTSLGDLPMAMRYRHIMTTVKEVLCVVPSAIHGRGLYCMQDISMGEMIVEYSGTLIRPGLCDIREKYYDSKGIGSYMFRIDAHEVVDATMSGSMARFINHSCDPNCYSRIINVEGKKKIIIFAERNIVRGEELTYDYKFPSEDIKIPCLCQSEKCRRWMN